MHMQVVHLLTAVPVAVDDQPVTVFGDAFATRQITRDREHMTDEGFIGILDVVGGRDRLVRHDQHMHGCTGLDVAKRRDPIILVDDVARYFARDDAFEQRRHDEPQYL